MEQRQTTPRIYKPYTMILMLVACAIAAFILRQIPKGAFSPILSLFLHMLRPSIYIAGYTVWAISLYRRISHRPVQRLILSVAGLLLLWLNLRTIKYQLPYEHTALSRYLWYLYYIPSVMIPTLSLCLGFYMGKPEDYRPPRWTNLILCIGLVCALLPLTNDLHHWCFRFPATPLPFRGYTYGPGFYLINLWCFMAGLLFLAMIFYQCRIPKNARLLPLPLIVFFFILLYSILPFVNYAFWEQWFGDITSAYSFLFALLLESCIVAGLIPSNTNYDQLFTSSSLRALIVDHQHQILAATVDAPSLEPEAMIRAETAPFFIAPGLRLSSAPISCGHVLWVDDVSQWQDSLEHLRQTTHLLKDAHQIERDNVALKKKRAALAIQEQLYLDIEALLRPSLASILAYSKAYEAAKDPVEKKDLLARAIIVGTYIKRRANLLLIERRSPLIPVKELELCITESLRQLKLIGVDSAYDSSATGDMLGTYAGEAYDFYEEIIKAAFGQLDTIFVRLVEQGDNLELRFLLETTADLTCLCHDLGATCEQDFDGSWIIRLPIPRGGEWYGKGEGIFKRWT